MDMHRVVGSVVLASALGTAIVGSALASSVVALSDTTTSAGTVAYNTNSALATPGSYTYADTFNAPTSAPISASLPDGFYDDFIFTITGASADSVTSTINLGNVLQIDGLQVALFTYNAGQQVPVAGSPLAAGWSQSIAGGIGTVSVISPTVLAPGSYALEVAGTVTGSAGGSYSGSLNLAPVPLPAGLPLLLSGLGVVGFWGRRRLK